MPTPTWTNAGRAEAYSAADHHTGDDLAGYTDRINALLAWRQDYLLPLADALGIRAVIERQQILYCQKHGWFDRLAQKQEQLTPSDVEAVVNHIRILLEENESDYRHVASAICADQATAQLVVKCLNLEGTPAMAADLSDQVWSIDELIRYRCQRK